MVFKNAFKQLVQGVKTFKKYPINKARQRKGDRLKRKINYIYSGFRT